MYCKERLESLTNYFAQLQIRKCAINDTIERLQNEADTLRLKSKELHQKKMAQYAASVPVDEGCEWLYKFDVQMASTEDMQRVAQACEGLQLRMGMHTSQQQSQQDATRHYPLAEGLQDNPPRQPNHQTPSPILKHPVGSTVTAGTCEHVRDDQQAQASKHVSWHAGATQSALAASNALMAVNRRLMQTQQELQTNKRRAATA